MNVTETNNDMNIFFLRGFMRSGTNWLGRILNLHPEINCQGEFHFDKLINEYKRINDFSCFDTNDNIHLMNNLVKNCIAQHCDLDSHKWVGDRTPVILNSILIQNTKYFLIHRDGRDVILSWFKHALKRNIGVLQQYPVMLENLSKYQQDDTYFENNKHELLNDEKFFKQFVTQWSDRIKMDLNLLNRVKNNQLNISVFFVKYEEMHLEIETFRDRLYQFLNLNPAFADGLKNNTEPGYELSEGKFERGRIGLWKDYFTDENFTWFEEVGGEALNLINQLNSEIIKPTAEV